MYRVLHILPDLRQGGVEVSAIRLLNNRNLEFQYTVLVLNYDIFKNPKILDNKNNSFIYFNHKIKLFRIIKCIKYIINNKYDLIIFSIWKSIIIGLIANIFSRDLNIYAYYHRSTSAHALDLIARVFGPLFYRGIICDSEATFMSIKNKPKSNSYILSPIFKYNTKYTNINNKNIVFIGRISKVKNIENAIKIMSFLTKYDKDFILNIYGDIYDVEYFKYLGILISDLDLLNNIKFLGAISPFEMDVAFKNNAYLISCSHTEGLAMGVIEAMSAGLVPIVRLNGGPKDYCIDGYNSIAINVSQYDDFEYVCNRIITLSQDEVAYKNLSNNAISTIEKFDSYEHAFYKIIKKCL